MIRSVLLLIFLHPMTISAQSAVEGLGGASDSAQQTFEQSRSTTAIGGIGKIYKRNKVDEKPAYPGGDDAFMDHVLNAEGCGVLPKMEDCFGSSKLSFDYVVNADGSVSDVEFNKEGCTVLHPVVLCALRRIEKWTPGKLNGVAVRVQMHHAVKYDLR